MRFSEEIADVHRQAGTRGGNRKRSRRFRRIQVTDYEPVERNLRDCFRALAARRDHAEIRESSGMEILSLGVRFQMFNAAFLSSPVEDESDFERRLISAAMLFGARGIEWSFWLCDALLPETLRKRAPRLLARNGLRLASQMPGMIATRLAEPSRMLPDCEVRLAQGADTLDHFREIGSVCFRVPQTWFEEVFDRETPDRTPFRAWVAYAAGRPVATAATVSAGGAIGLYNVGTLPEFRGGGFAEAITRDCIAREFAATPDWPVVLQSTEPGLGLYERLGFEEVTRFRVWVA